MVNPSGSTRSNRRSLTFMRLLGDFQRYRKHRYDSKMMISNPLMRPLFSSFFIIWLAASSVWATDLPSLSYIFPAGGQRGTTVDVRIGAHYMHGSAPLRLVGHGVKASESIRQIDRIWFEGPMIRKPFSKELKTIPKTIRRLLKSPKMRRSVCVSGKFGLPKAPLLDALL